MLTTDLHDLKYVAVEVIKNPGSKIIDVECGAFMGVVTHESGTGAVTTFVALQNTVNSIRLYNINEYGIVTVQAQSKDMRYMTVFTKNDQVEAVNLLKQIVAAMKAQRRLYSLTPGNELINVDSYTNMPEIVLTGNNLSSSITDKTETTNTNTGDHRGTSAAGYSYDSGYTPYVAPQKPTILSFKRKGKLPTEERLKQMRFLVSELSEKNITFKIPIPKCDIPEQQQIVETEQEAHPPNEQYSAV